MDTIYLYSNYRIYLKDHFKLLRATDPQFSQKRVMIDLGVRSSGFLSNVLSAKKNLNPSQVEKLSILLSHTKMETRYFKALVGYDQARNSADKQSNYEIIQDVQAVKFKDLEGVELDLFSHWYFVAIRELIALNPFLGDFKVLSQSLRPSITMNEAREAIYFLESGRFIERDSKGKYHVVDALISSKNEIRSTSVVGFQNVMIDFAKEALAVMPVAERDISSISFSASQEMFERIKKEMQEFRKYILDLAESEQTDASVLYQCNMQFFPISKEINAKKGGW
ncbi:MAG: TIGR02147 family protein [Fibrobacterales bacterium]